MEPFSVELIERPPAVVLRLQGEARIDVSPLDAQGARVVALHPPVVILDMACLTFCASVGMRGIFFLRQNLGRIGSITRLAAVHPDVLDSFKRAAILPLFEVFSTVDEAVTAPLATAGGS